MDYKFGNKNNWRRWAWNRIVERIVPERRNDPILYLAGEQDLDRRVAVAKGLDGRNLIAIEQDRKVSKMLRKNKVLTITGCLYDILLAWPTNRPLAAVVVDGCRGYDNSVQVHSQLVFRRSVFAGTVFLFNFLRGREMDKGAMDGLGRICENKKHRGEMMLAQMAIAVPRPKAAWSSWREFIDYSAEVLVHFDPAMSSYRSTANQVFDSLVFRVPLLPAYRTYFHSDLYENLLASIEADLKIDAKAIRYRRSIAAVLAHRTMRMNA